jgi:hypothetical protein
VARVAGEQDAGRDAAEQGPAEVGDRHQHLLDELETADPAQLRHRPEPGPDRREGSEQRGDDVGTDPVPLVDERQPGVAVPRVGLVHHPGGAGPVAVEDRPLAVGEQVTEHCRGVPPDEAVPLELEGLDRLGRSGQRVERAEGVMHEPFVDLGVAAHRAADLGLGLEHEHRPAGVRQVVGRDQAVRPRPDHDGVVRRSPSVGHCPDFARSPMRMTTLRGIAMSDMTWSPRSRLSSG